MTTPDCHPLHSVVRLKSWYDANAETVSFGLFDDGQLKDMETWTQEPAVSEIAQLVENWGRVHGGLSAEELRFMIDTAGSVDTHLEHAPHDLARYGEVGVTY